MAQLQGENVLLRGENERLREEQRPNTDDEAWVEEQLHALDEPQQAAAVEPGGVEDYLESVDCSDVEGGGVVVMCYWRVGSRR